MTVNEQARLFFFFFFLEYIGLRYNSHAKVNLSIYYAPTTIQSSIYPSIYHLII